MESEVPVIAPPLSPCASIVTELVLPTPKYKEPAVFRFRIYEDVL